jgi:hypothetical protein
VTKLRQQNRQQRRTKGKQGDSFINKKYGANSKLKGLF